MTKMTYATALETVIALDVVKANAELCDKLMALKASIEKKSSAERKQTKTQVANEGLKGEILDILTAEPDRLFTATEIGKCFEEELSNQKVSALLRQMIADGKVAKVVDGRKSYFKAV